ncbi:hypothetical protein SAMN02745248_01470 [Hathewaya proteolytica DSM 3090]|uniref:GrdX protein n=1 Tax=Hathewaya proteolytica DSM 3090 TaxID=1121331 RepID=A0A1M6NSK0_9CLOT|nr:GrdX family protein [Hathewaya proteolytica]SHJ98635.1 hypothetical protein SAMN02745248_01470 [Hathewaya proteolytica DSM 3090]
MIERLFMVTNNPMSYEKFKESYRVIYIDGKMEDVYNRVRDEIHGGHKLLTHPLMGSVKPNETPYRTICVSEEKVKGTDADSVLLMENCIMTLRKFLSISPLPQYPESTLNDFQVIDYDLINHALE